MSRLRVVPARTAIVGTVLLLAAGLALSPAAAERRVKELLPDLVALKPFEAYVVEGPTGCDAYERVEEGAEECLRYDTTVLNLGKGAAELRYHTDQLGRDQLVDQRIYLSNGDHRDRAASNYEYHPVHGHFHYANFAIARLWAADRSGEIAGEDPVAESLKAGFCLADGDNYWSSSKKEHPQKYVHPYSCWPTQVEGSEVAQVSGLSPGWADTYEASLSDQYIEISDVADGYYVLEIEIDPDRTFKESDTSNNSSFNLLLLQTTSEGRSVSFPEPSSGPAAHS